MRGEGLGVGLGLDLVTATVVVPPGGTDPKVQAAVAIKAVSADVAATPQGELGT